MGVAIEAHRFSIPANPSLSGQGCDTRSVQPHEALPLGIAAQVPLAPLTTLGIGGPARFFARVEREEQIPALMAWAEQQARPVFVLGGGSNLLVADRGYDGLVLAIALRGIRGEAEEVTAAAGEPWDAFVERCVARDWAGIECLSGIPGTVGGTPVQNVGAYGQDVAETIVAVRAWDRERREFVELDRTACRFGYRASLFNRDQPGRFIVTAARFRLQPGGAPALRYAELQRRFAGAARPGLRDVREAVREIRRGKAMLIEPDQPESHSAGSFFKNPIVSEAQAEAVAARAGEPPPRFATPEGVKLPAAWLIERAGFSRGYRPPAPGGGAGRVGLSSRHALAIVNYSGASAAEVAALARRIRDAVAARFGIPLAPEPVWLGFNPGERL